MARVFDRGETTSRDGSPLKADCPESGSAEVSLEDQSIVSCSEEDAIICLVCHCATVALLPAIHANIDKL